MTEMVLAMIRLPPNRSAKLLVTALTVMSFGISPVSAQVPSQDQDQAGTDAIESTQGFALFEAIESSENRATTPTRRGNRESRATVAQPEFTLLGTSRIGDKYTAIIQHKDGEAIVVKAGPGASTSIPEHGDYSIVNVTAGTVSIRYPGNTTCVEFSERGVSCNEAGNTADLTLAASEPLAPSKRSLSLVTQSNEIRANANGDNPITAQTDVVNPFAALREAQVENPADNSTSSSGGRFTPRRIAPEDVPPGMRVVSTPFGDRLVEQ